MKRNGVGDVVNLPNFPMAERKKFGKFTTSPLSLLAFYFLSVGFAACQFRPSYPSDKTAGALKKMCSKNYGLSVEARRAGDSLQAFIWRVGMMRAGQAEMRPEAAEAFERALLCATRIRLSTDDPLKFLEIKMVDALTGATVSLFRFVPDIKDSMYSRFAEEEYFSRLVLEFETRRDDRKKEWKEVDWDPPMTMQKFLAKQVVSRLKRRGPLGLQAHEDLSRPQTLTVVLDNWNVIEKQGARQKQDVTDLMEQTARKVVHGYRYTGFREFVLQNQQGLALKRGVF